MGIGKTVTVILPTHNHPATLSYSIRSILEQSFEDFNLVVIGDGIRVDSRDIICEFMERDNRVEFLDVPKSKRHGEQWRDAVIRESNSKYIAYHGDDDLMLPKHLETLLSEIENSNFIHTLPIQVGKEGKLNFLPTDISIRGCLNWHLSDEVHNAVSLTGVMHSRELYLNLPVGWEEAPVGIPSDLFMWKKFFAADEFNGKSSRVSTTIKLDASRRMNLSDTERQAEIESWWYKIHEPNFQVIWGQLTGGAVHRLSVNQFLRILNLEFELDLLKEASRVEVTAQIGHLMKMNDALNLELSDIKNSTIWRTTRPIRVILNILKRVLK
jgi:glycosyltransferase involved in cell wall biosynthesis